MEKTARQIEYSYRNGVSHGRRQTNFIPGGPKPPKYNGMNDVEKAMAKQVFECPRGTKYQAYVLAHRGNTSVRVPV
jgi:hypothetical protein